MSAPETFVNLSEYPDPESDEFFSLSPDEQYRLEDYLILTQEATAVKPGARVISHLYCEEEDERGDLCEGDIELVRIELPSEIRWKCQRCGQHGKIIGFENGESDLSYLPEETAREFIEDTYGMGINVDEDSSMSFADFLDIEGLIEELAEDEESFVNWFLNLPDEEKINYLDEIGVDIIEPDGSFEEQTGGLNPMQLFNILTCDWAKNDGPVRLSGKLTAKDVSGSILFHNARTMLLKLQKEDGLGLTKTGNLQRKSITELMTVCNWPEGYLEAVIRHNKVVNEHDIWLLHSTRILLEAAGLIRKYKGKLKAVKKLSGLSLSSRSGELYRHLFITYFQKINISYLTNNIYEYPNVQENTPFALYRLQQLAGDWVSIRELEEKIFIPMAYDDIAIRANSYTKTGWLVYSLMLKPLELFGLIETRKTGDEPEWSYHPDQCRKTPLFDKFISFRF
ncbi:hypothetical protein BH23BAC3_BH23BAC3_24240 [soil metagenome]